VLDFEAAAPRRIQRTLHNPLDEVAIGRIDSRQESIGRSAACSSPDLERARIQPELTRRDM
jgi:hypothetical protein